MQKIAGQRSLHIVNRQGQSQQLNRTSASNSNVLKAFWYEDIVRKILLKRECFQRKTNALLQIKSDKL